MATKSILKNINIKGKRMGRNFISALETSQNKPGKKVVVGKSCSVLKKEQIKSLFGVNDGK